MTVPPASPSSPSALATSPRCAPSTSGSAGPTPEGDFAAFPLGGAVLTHLRSRAPRRRGGRRAGYGGRPVQGLTLAINVELPRAGLTANVHQRVNVRMLELIDDETGQRVELEGDRIPLTHSKDAIDVLTSS